MIGLYSKAPQAGKSTVANLLRDDGYLRMSFADPLKTIADKFFDVIGVDPFNLIGKDRPVPTWVDIKVTPRHVWQTLGTEWGRNAIDPDLWVKIAKYRVALMQKQNDGYSVPIVFDDVRFLNEFDAIKAMGGEMWVVNRPGIESNGHVSDGLLTDQMFDRAVMNDGDLEALKHEVSNALWNTKKKILEDQYAIDFTAGALTYANEAPPLNAYKDYE